MKQDSGTDSRTQRYTSCVYCMRAWETAQGKYTKTFLDHKYYTETCGLTWTSLFGLYSFGFPINVPIIIYSFWQRQERD